jgi:transposase
MLRRAPAPPVANLARGIKDKERTISQKRNPAIAVIGIMPRCLIGMEACVGAHHLSRKLTSLGHDARLMPAKYVRPYSRGRRTTSAMPRRSSRRWRPNDEVRRDRDRRATRLANAPAVREQPGTGIINEIRGFLLERGVAVRQGLRFLRAAVRSPMIARGAAPADLAGAWRCAPGALKPPLTLWAIRGGSTAGPFHSRNYPMLENSR